MLPPTGADDCRPFDKLTAGLAGSEAIEMTHPLALFGTGLAEAVQ
jgi:hypothetical protein